jgi:hypothetical protein
VETQALFPLAPESVRARFESRIATGPGCWLWLGSKTRDGYGQFSFMGRRTGAHRFAYEWSVGPIPVGCEIDHLCRTRDCVRPDHMEPVTHRVNSLRGNTTSARNAAKTHCPRGHELAGANLVPWKLRQRGSRECLICDRAGKRRSAQERRHAGSKHLPASSIGSDPIQTEGGAR